MDRFVAHCVATALITAAFAAVSTVRAESSGAAVAPAGGSPVSASASVSVPAAAVSAVSGVSASVPSIPLPEESVPMIPGVGVAVSGASADPIVQTWPDPAGPNDPGVQAGVSTGAVCADASQVGSTAYAWWHGRIIFSVKQYYSPSCHARYSYAYPWLRFREQHADYAIGLAVFDTTHDELDGAVTDVDGVGSPDYFSAPVTLAPGTCSEATVHLFLPDDETDTFTQDFCL